jgi:antitoxin VapB
MSLNIKNPRVHELAREAARVTGKTQTAAIEEALERLLTAYDVDPVAARSRAKIDVVTGLVVEYRADPGDDRRTLRVVEDLYDDSTGLPQ